jgi:hypothetical protein
MSDERREGKEKPNFLEEERRFYYLDKYQEFHVLV